MTTRNHPSDPGRAGLRAAAATLALALLIGFAAGPAEAQITATRGGGQALYHNPVLGDVNGDGLADIVGVDRATGGVGLAGEGRVYLNQGDGAPGVAPTFVATAQVLPGTAMSGSYGHVGQLGDLDDDGDLDLFAVPLPYFNDGAGNFTVSTQAPLEGGNGYWGWTEPVDLDGDGDLDAVTYDRSTGQYIYEGDGTGVFTLVHHAEVYGAAAPPVDFNGDGFLDLLVRKRGIWVLLNDGSNGFTEHFEAPWAGNYKGAAAADMNRDGHVDILYGTNTYFNDGADPPSFGDPVPGDPAGGREPLLAEWPGPRAPSSASV